MYMHMYLCIYIHINIHIPKSNSPHFVRHQYEEVERKGVGQELPAARTKCFLLKTKKPLYPPTG